MTRTVAYHTKKALTSYCTWVSSSVTFLQDPLNLTDPRENAGGLGRLPSLHSRLCFNLSGKKHHDLGLESSSLCVFPEARWSRKGRRPQQR